MSKPGSSTEMPTGWIVGLASEAASTPYLAASNLHDTSRVLEHDHVKHVRKEAPVPQSRKPRATRSPSNPRRARAARQARPPQWSRQVAERSDALDLQPGVFTSNDPRRIARSLKRSAQRSTRRKAKPFQSAMSMLNLYINRAGRTLPARKRRVLERAKQELRVAFGRAR
jgi:hypothetical protein